jgi:hypothetical protein
MKLPGSFGFSIPSYFSSSYEFTVQILGISLCRFKKKTLSRKPLIIRGARQVGKMEFHLERFISFYSK